MPGNLRIKTATSQLQSKKKNVYLKDKICQLSESKHELQFDHTEPDSFGGKSSEEIFESFP